MENETAVTPQSNKKKMLLAIVGTLLGVLFLFGLVALIFAQQGGFISPLPEGEDAVRVVFVTPAPSLTLIASPESSSSAKPTPTSKATPKATLKATPKASTTSGASPTSSVKPSVSPSGTPKASTSPSPTP